MNFAKDGRAVAAKQSRKLIWQSKRRRLDEAPIFFLRFGVAGRKQHLKMTRYSILFAKERGKDGRPRVLRHLARDRSEIGTRE